MKSRSIASLAAALLCLSGCAHHHPAETPTTQTALATAEPTTQELAPTTEALAPATQAIAAATEAVSAATQEMASTAPTTLPSTPEAAMPATMPTSMPAPTTSEIVPPTAATPAMTTPAETAITPATAPTTAPAALTSSVMYAIATIEPKSGSHASGTITFTQTDAGVQVVADIDGLTPGEHAMHIHQYADLSDEKGEGAGGHYDPDHTHHHGLPGDPMPHHPGDMGNLDADANGHAHLEILLSGVTINGEHDPILGRSVVIHAKPDDGSQPTGNAGGRVGVGVIGVAKAPL